MPIWSRLKPSKKAAKKRVLFRAPKAFKYGKVKISKPKHVSKTLNQKEESKRMLDHKDRHASNTANHYRMCRARFNQYLKEKLEGSQEVDRPFKIEDVKDYILHLFTKKKPNGQLYAVQTLRSHKGALMDMCKEYHLEKEFKQECEPVFQNQMESFQGLYRKERQNNLNDLQGIDRESYTLKEYKSMCLNFYGHILQEGAARKVGNFQKLLGMLRSMSDFQLGHYTMLRGNSRVLTQMSHICLSSLSHCPEGYDHKQKVIIFQRNVDKSLKDREIKSTSIVRASNVQFCPVFSLSLYFLFRFGLQTENLPGFGKREDWYNSFPLFTDNTTRSKPLSTNALSTAAKRFLQVASEKQYTKVTHIGRKGGSKIAGELGVPTSEIAKHGGWTESGVLQNFYLDKQCSTLLFRLFGHDFDMNNNSASMSLDRAVLNFESDVFKKVEATIFPWIEKCVLPSLKEQFGHQVDFDGETLNLRIAKGAKKGGPDLRLHNLWNVMSYMRRVLIEDLVEMFISHSEEMKSLLIPYFPIFGSNDFCMLVEAAKVLKQNPELFFDYNPSNPDWNPLLDETPPSSRDYHPVTPNSNDDEHTSGVLKYLPYLDLAVLGAMKDRFWKRKVVAIDDLHQLTQMLIEANSRSKKNELCLGTSVALSETMREESKHQKEFRTYMMKGMKEVLASIKQYQNSITTNDLTISQLKAEIKKRDLELDKRNKEMEALVQNNNKFCEKVLQLISMQTTPKSSTVSVATEVMKPAGKEIRNSMLRKKDSYRGPYFLLGCFKSFSELYTDWKKYILPLCQKGSLDWVSHSGNSKNTYYQTKYCAELIEILNRSYFSSSNGGNTFAGCEILEHFTTDKYKSDIHSFLNHLPAPKKFLNSAFQLELHVWLRDHEGIYMRRISNFVDDDDNVIIAEVEPKRSYFRWEEDYARCKLSSNFI